MMEFLAKARFIRFSPFKLRPIADVVRGKNVQDAIDWLTTYAVKRSVPMKKAIQSAAANAKSGYNIDPSRLVITDIRVDQGPSFRYFKPGAMGRADVQKKRTSHVSVIVKSIDKEA